MALVAKFCSKASILRNATQVCRILSGSSRNLSNVAEVVSTSPPNNDVSRRMNYQSRRRMEEQTLLEAEAPYARNLPEYNKALSILIEWKKVFLLRRVYDDMLMDGIAPSRDTFHILIVGCMITGRLQDSLYFFNEMKISGMLPDLALFNCIIKTCAKALQVDKAFQIAQEMESMGISPKLRTFMALLEACGNGGRVVEANGVIQRMAMQGLAVNPVCYVSLINAHKNRRPREKNYPEKILELLEASKESFSESALDLLRKSGEYFNERNKLLCHEAALSALEDFKSEKHFFQIVMEVETLEQKPSFKIMHSIMRFHLKNGKPEMASKEFDKLQELGFTPTIDVYVDLLELSILLFKQGSFDFGLKLLEDMEKNRLYLNTAFGTKLLSLACKDRFSDFSLASKIYEITTAANMFISDFELKEFAKGLKKRGVPNSDPRIKAIVVRLGPVFGETLEQIRPFIFTKVIKADEKLASESSGGKESEAPVESPEVPEDEQPSDEQPTVEQPK